MAASQFDLNRLMHQWLTPFKPLNHSTMNAAFERPQIHDPPFDVMNELGGMFDMVKEALTEQTKNKLGQDVVKFKNPLTAAFTSMSGDEDGAMCFKTCGMEGAMKDVSILTKDISHSLATGELCLIITTIVLCICLLSLTITTVCVLIRKHWPSAKRRQNGSGVDYDTRSMVSNEYAEPAWQIPIKKLEALVPPPPGKH